jgi:hypothetical protein
MNGPALRKPAGFDSFDKGEICRREMDIGFVTETQFHSRDTAVAGLTRDPQVRTSVREEPSFFRPTNNAQ